MSSSKGKIKEGLVLYSIELDGCLNGVYTNEHSTVAGIIFNEVARPKTETNLEKDQISGIYDCFYFDLNNSRVNAELFISSTGRIFNFEWKDLSGRLIFSGVGYKMNKRQISVHYWEP